MNTPLIETQLANAVLISREKIRPAKQPRGFFDPPQMRELAASIKAHGILQPLIVRYELSRYDGGAYVIVAGERRFRASEGILDDLPCILQDVDADSAQFLTLIENMQRTDLTALEEANGLRELMTKQNLSALRAAKVLHVSPGWINNRLALLKTKPDVLAVAAKSPFAMSSLLMIDGVKDSALRRDLLQQVEGGAAHSQIKTRVELHHAEKQESAKAQSTHAPDRETQTRQTEYSAGRTPNMSRNLFVTGTRPGMAKETIEESLSTIEAKAATIEHWLETLDDNSRAKMIPRFARIAARFAAILD